MLALARSAAALVAPWARCENGRERFAEAVPALTTRVRRVKVFEACVAACARFRVR
jgi:hypothetical protein